MTSKKMESAQNFLKSLESPSTTIKIMTDRMDTETLQVITNYSDLISKVKQKTTVNDKDLFTCTMILGFLLKGHIDRYDLEKNLKDL
ncbi:MAG: hypothetical protein WC197_02170 [Candidatus Gastranaerophilaceae bacterium]